MDALLQQRFSGTFFDLLGIRITESDKTCVTGELIVVPTFLNPRGQLHGGVMTGLADSLAGMGAFLTLPEGATGFATIELKVNLLRTVGVGHIIRCKATPVHQGRTTQVWDAEVWDIDRPGKPLALFRCTQAIFH